MDGGFERKMTRTKANGRLKGGSRGHLMLGSVHSTEGDRGGLVHREHTGRGEKILKTEREHSGELDVIQDIKAYK